jgi:serine/threonine-protein phosphatase 2B catalytic subunit
MSAKKDPVETQLRKTVVMDRVVKSVVAPPLFPLTYAELFDASTNLPRLDVLKAHLLKEGRLDKKAYSALVERAGALLKAEDTLLTLSFPLTVCGDIHGQFFDLVRLFEVGGDPATTQYLFLGDYVDRGCFSTEVVFYLYAHKICYPNSLFMLRGNHECRQLTSFFNFKDECTYKYDLALYDMIMESFDMLPLAAIVDKSFFCVHGGLSPDINRLQEVAAINRFQEIPREGAMCDLLWSDPFENADVPDGAYDGVPIDDQPQAAWFGYNDTRQCSYVYGIEAVKQFLADNSLTSLVRAHEAQVDGFKMQMVDQSSGVPRVITIFSAPNYCDCYKNKAACLKFDTAVLNIKQFVNSPHPYYRSNFMDVFQWSLPFVAEKVTDMLASVLDYGEDESAGEAAPVEVKQTVFDSKGKLLKTKVQSISKILRIYRILREESETILHLKQLTPHKKIPLGLLQKGAKALQEVLSSFEKAKQYDKQYESRPNQIREERKVRGSVNASSAHFRAKSREFSLRNLHKFPGGPTSP